MSDYSIVPLASGVALTMCLVADVSAQRPVAPPHAAAMVSVSGAHVRLVYDRRTIFDGTIDGVDSATTFQTLVDSTGGHVTQVLKWTSFSKSRLALRGRVSAGDESFPAESDRNQDALPIVRHSTSTPGNSGSPTVTSSASSGSPSSPKVFATKP